jgi:deoxyribodipyrimidine photo-lyase
MTLFSKSDYILGSCFTNPFTITLKAEVIDWSRLEQSLEVDTTVGPVTSPIPGTEAGLANLRSFCDLRLKRYADLRNDPNEDVLSGVSPWAHFGQISMQRAALTVRARGGKGADVFIEEAVVRRELSDNFCYYQKVRRMRS